MNKMTKIEGLLLEGCVWEECQRLLYFLDIECRKIYCLNPFSNKLECMEMPNYISCIVPDKQGNLIAALPEGLYQINFQKRMSKRIFTESLPEGIRYNDGKCDADGRLWIGSMAICQDEAAKGVGVLYCIENEKIVREYSGYSIPNGLAWGDDNLFFYHVDTPTKKVDRYKIKKGILLEEKTTAVSLYEEEGSPDGMCMDREGNLWIAMWGGSKVICADPRTGKTLEEISVPDKNVSCCTFGGPELNQLYITTAKDEDGNGGELYMQEMKVKGVTVNRYGK